MRLKNKLLRKLARLARNVAYLFADITGTLFVRPWLKSRKLSDITQAEKILIIRNDNIGDMVVSTPAISAIREKFPNATIDVLANITTKAIIEGNTDINNIYTNIKSTPHDYTIAIALRPGFDVNYYTIICGATIRTGYKAHGAGFMLTHGCADDRKISPRHEIQSAMNIAATIGCSNKMRPTKIIMNNGAIGIAKQFVKETTGEHKLITIHVGGRQPYLHWNIEKFAILAENLINQGYGVTFIGHKDEQVLVGKIQKQIKPISFWAGELTLSAQIALLQESKLFIGNISGPMHIASALNVPLIAIYGPKDNIDGPIAWSPINKNSIIITTHEKCTKKCDSAFCDDFRCLGDISVEMVLSAANKLLT
jgi:ADP-heptose:LPS heptosyltransferase